MKGFTKLNVAPATRHRSKLDLSRQHLTSLNFAEIVPLFHEELCIGDIYPHIGANIFARMSPLVVPTFGKADLKTLSVFLPYYQVAKDFDAFKMGQKHFNGANVVQRTFTADELRKFLTSTDVLPYVSTIVTKPSGATDTDTFWYDFVVWNKIAGTSHAAKYYKFTAQGKYYYKILRSLGYQIPTELSETASENTKVFSAMPLLAYFKVFNDLMSQSTKMNTSELSMLLYNIKIGVTHSGAYDSTTGRLSEGAFRILFRNLALMYQSDYFTSAWRYPNAAVDQSSDNQTSLYYTSGTDGSVRDLISGNTSVYGHNPVQTTSNEVNITARQIQFLRAFDNFVRRKNYAGSRTVDEIYAQSGIKSDDYKSHMPDIITSDSMPLQIGDIMCNADTYNSDTKEGMKVGEYTGKGIISGQSHFGYNARENGMLFVLGWIQVKPIYADGYDRAVLRTSYQDYYQQEFDGLSGDAISVGEVTTNNKGYNPNRTSWQKDDAVFGFTEKYNAYRYGHDQITGDFVTLAGMDSWHFGRDLENVRATGNCVAQSDSMVKQGQFGSEYNRIFSIVDGVEDKFYLTCFFDVEAIRPMGNLSDVADLGNGEVSIDRGGNVIQ